MLTTNAMAKYHATECLLLFNSRAHEAQSFSLSHARALLSCAFRCAAGEELKQAVLPEPEHPSIDQEVKIAQEKVRGPCLAFVMRSSVCIPCMLTRFCQRKIYSAI